MARGNHRRSFLRRLFSRRGRNIRRGGGEPGPVRRLWRKHREAIGRGFWTLAFWSTLAGILGVGGYALYVSPEVASRFEGRRWRIPSQVYSDVFTLLPGQDIENIGLLRRLTRMNYQETESKVLRKGEYRRSGDVLDIHLRDFDYPGERVLGYWLRIELKDGRIAKLVNASERREVFSADIEPELIGRFFGQEREQRELVPLSDVPAGLIAAVLAIEDRYFYVHPGVNPISTVRALFSNLIHLGGQPGGSTLTQQLVKNFYLSPERTLSRKFKEMVRALVLELIYSKEEILEAYLNEIYFGQSGSVAICGVGEAARFFFQKDVRSLDLAESATLAALIRSPDFYNPRRAIDRAKARRDLILAKMRRQNLITQEEYDRARGLEIRIVRHRPPQTIAPYFIDFLKRQLEETYSTDILISEGLRIFTTLDVTLQEQAEAALRRGIEDLEARYPRLKKDPEQPLEAGIVVLQPQTGYLRAMMGGRGYRETQLNRVVDSRRQPGSVFKPLVYLAGFERSVNDGDFRFTAADRVTDEPVEWRLDGRRVWSPDNYGNEEFGTVTVRMGLEKSINRVTVALARRIGLGTILDTARAIGIRSQIPRLPSVVLGAAEVTPLEVAEAFSTLAAQGSHARPLSIREVVDSEGHVLQKKTVKVRQVVSPQAAYLATYLMQGVLDRGTGASARAMGFSRTAAGKTGTTNDSRDAWFVGYTPELVAAVWVGFDKDQTTGLTGATGALPIWVDFMKHALDGLPDEAFPVPPGIVFARIDRETGLLATDGCTDVIDEAFLEGTEPTEECAAHKDPIIERFKSMFRENHR